MARPADLLTSMRTILPLLTALGLVAACGTSEPTGDLRTVSEIHTELLFHQDRLETELENAAAPVKVGHLRPKRTSAQGASPNELPALLMAPPARVAFEATGDFVLEAAFGVDEPSTRDLVAGRTYDLTWSVSVNGERRAGGDHGIVKNKLTPGGWNAVVDQAGAALSLKAGDRIVLETTTSHAELWQHPDALRPLVGFSRLQLRETSEVATSTASTERPNVLLVIMDTLRGDRTTVNGYDAPTTPHLQALADRGTTYRAAKATSSWTWPSTASILTGLLPEEHGVEEPNGSYLHGEIDTIAEYFQREGAATAGFVGNRLISAPHNFDQGFQEFFAPDRPEFIDGYELIPRATTWLDEHADERFFLYLQLVDPHRPYQPHDESIAALPHVKPEGFRHVKPDKVLRELWAEVNDVPEGAPRPVYDSMFSPEHQAWLDGSYDQVVHTGDLWLGQLLAKLEELGVADDTLVIFTADHGEEFLDHGMFSHGQSLYPEVVDVPLVVAGPGIQAGVTVDEPVSNRHVFELLRDACEGRIDGAEPVPATGDPVFYSTRRGIWNGQLAQSIHGVRRGRWSLHLAPASPAWGAPVDAPAPTGGTSRLYDLDNDPGEFRDVKEDFPEVHAELLDLLLLRLAASARQREALGVTGLDSLEAGAATIEMLKDIGYL